MTREDAQKVLYALKNFVQQSMDMDEFGYALNMSIEVKEEAIKAILLLANGVE